ncbi:hypothetical protein HDU77_011594 [Chytriomyces hyalinus]|nr:hypothetical protein HDU77_011594 [Chytriomyces hyalinus]
MSRQARKTWPATTPTPAVLAAAAAREGDAEIPSELDLFFLELDALFNANQDRERLESLHANILADMREELARDATARRDTVALTESESVTNTDSTAAENPAAVGGKRLMAGAVQSSCSSGNGRDGGGGGDSGSGSQSGASLDARSGIVHSFDQMRQL